jgi:hypothetical protein
VLLCYRIPFLSLYQVLVKRSVTILAVQEPSEIYKQNIHNITILRVLYHSVRHFLIFDLRLSAVVNFQCVRVLLFL